MSHSSPNVGVSGKQWPTQGAGRGLSITELVHALAILGQCRINANRGPWQLFARAPLLTRDKDLSQPASRVDTTCWQLFRPAINTAHFYFLLQMLCQITWLLTGWKNFSISVGPLRPEARGICHICHMVNPALWRSDALVKVCETAPCAGGVGLRQTSDDGGAVVGMRTRVTH